MQHTVEDRIRESRSPLYGDRNQTRTQTSGGEILTADCNADVHYTLPLPQSVLQPSADVCADIAED